MSINIIIIRRKNLFTAIYIIGWLLLLLNKFQVVDSSSNRGNNSNLTNVATTTVVSASLRRTKVVTWWKPKASATMSWQIQFDGNIITSYTGVMYDIDLYTVSDAVIRTLKKAGKKVICYFSAGTYEYYRKDWSEYFPFITEDVMYNGTESPFGKIMPNWTDERYLDIRRIDLLSPIMIHRIQYAKQRGCDGIDPDNLDTYLNPDTGFPLSYNDQLTYNKFIEKETLTQKRN